MDKLLPLPKKLGIIDLGSNSARLMVADYAPGLAFRVTDEVSRRVRLSEGMAADKKLRPAAMKRALETLRMFRAFCDAHGVPRVIPVATAAVRDAANRAEFLARAETEAGVKLRVLTGEEEAYFGVLGVVNSLGLRAGLVMDMGGGSAEVSAVRAGRFTQSTLTALGAVRLTELFLPARGSEKVKKSEVNKLRAHIDEVFQNVGWLALGANGQFVGVGGTARALVKIDRETQGYPLGLVNGYPLELAHLEDLIERLIALPVADRPRRIPGLPNDRADIILAGALVWAAALRRAKASQVVVCGHGLRDGLFFKEFLKPTPEIPHLREFSVHNLGRLYGYELAHVTQVAKLALSLFDQLTHWHGYGDAERECLWAAAQLHDIGTLIDYYDHHKHSAYIVLSAGLPGYTHRELVLIALLCLYHRKGKPDLGAYASLMQADDLPRVRRLAALLRLAEYLDRSRVSAVARLTVETTGQAQARLTLHPRPQADAQVERWEAERNAELFEAAFGCELTMKVAA